MQYFKTCHLILCHLFICFIFLFDDILFVLSYFQLLHLLLYTKLFCLVLVLLDFILFRFLELICLHHSFPFPEELPGWICHPCLGDRAWQGWVHLKTKLKTKGWDNHKTVSGLNLTVLFEANGLPNQLSKQIFDSCCVTTIPYGITHFYRGRSHATKANQFRILGICWCGLQNVWCAVSVAGAAAFSIGGMESGCVCSTSPVESYTMLHLQT